MTSANDDVKWFLQTFSIFLFSCIIAFFVSKYVGVYYGEILGFLALLITVVVIYFLSILLLLFFLFDD